MNQRSRSLSRSISSGVCPVWKAIRSFITVLMCSMLSAWMAMSAAVPPMPPDSWCIMIRACGSANRLPGVPAQSRNWPIEAAMPMAMVATSFLMYCIVS